MGVLYFSSQLAKGVDQNLYRALLHTGGACDNPLSRSGTQISGQKAHSGSGCHDVYSLFTFGQGFYHDLGIIAIGQVFRRINAFTQRIDDECTVADTFGSWQLDCCLYHGRGNKFIEHHSKYILCYGVQK